MLWLAGVVVSKDTEMTQFSMELEFGSEFSLLDILIVKSLIWRSFSGTQLCEDMETLKHKGRAQI